MAIRRSDRVRTDEAEREPALAARWRWINTAYGDGLGALQVASILAGPAESALGAAMDAITGIASDWDCVIKLFAAIEWGESIQTLVVDHYLTGLAQPLRVALPEG